MNQGYHPPPYYRPSPDPIQLSKSKMFKPPRSGLVQLVYICVLTSVAYPLKGQSTSGHWVIGLLGFIEFVELLGSTSS
jgi:hypothetical protein